MGDIKWPVLHFVPIPKKTEQGKIANQLNIGYLIKKINISFYVV
jgi:hypothetical protein